MNILASIFNLGGPDLIVILLIVLLLFGAKKLPELARGMGQAMKEFNKAKEDIETEIKKTGDELTVQTPKESQPQKPTTTPPVPTITPPV
jgi:sec-independent protein translocase protein TatA